MTFIETIIYGLVQGIGEFLPISSSANLLLISKILNNNELSFFDEIILHVGTLLALVVYFYKEIERIILGLFTSREKLTNTYFLPLILATIPIVVFTLVFKRLPHTNSHIGFMLILFGLILFITDKYASKITITVSNTYIKYLILGCFQSISIIPGVSRLGICIIGCRILGFSRKESITTSLLLDIPSICGSLVFAICNNATYSSSMFFPCIITGIIGLFCANYCIRYMTKYGFGLITVYRIIIGLFFIHLQ